MGYRSEVGVLITVPDKVNSDKLLKKIAGVYGEYFRTDFDEIKQFKKYGKRFISLYCGWIKWYESFDDIHDFMEFLSSWDENYKTGGVHFLRVGEHLDDIEENIYGNPAEYLGLERRLVCEF